MFKVEVQNTCRCFLRDGLPETQEFVKEEDAKNEAESLLKYMQDNFCKKHEFDLQKSFAGYTVYIKSRS